ncbi:hypothetical protein KC332_g3703 [Hortaea werneckii]|nr:hypothetical protein KC358_g1785 [Hortaea werneckii]KAI6851623.1 hypothetical protein KC350_g1567 [Hortaea werneckii]KAI6948385.1 hypothetical protein KC348_g1962 [Hortaea werneckii]KAI6979477.1 hypothetical protein KC321_g2333 [Hortaea werneckii]KAI6996390.1 hypothetical protein KC329_g2033 [Hortaea werneckii]
MTPPPIAEVEVIGVTSDDGSIRYISSAASPPFRHARGSTLDMVNQSASSVKLAQDSSPGVAYQCTRPVKHKDDPSIEVARQNTRPLKNAGNHCLDVASRRAPSPDLTENSSEGSRKDASAQPTRNHQLRTVHLDPDVVAWLTSAFFSDETVATSVSAADDNEGDIERADKQETKRNVKQEGRWNEDTCTSSQAPGSTQ